VNFNDPKLERIFQEESGTKDREDLEKVLTSLALCHDIVIDTATGKYNAASPDELALVNFAKQVGFHFKGYDDHENMLLDNTRVNDVQKYKLLHVCEFTSARKRMSVIVRDETDNGTIKLICKGADSIIAGVLSDESRSSQVFQST
jgi:phospholipid-transporting ATPase